MESNQQDMTFIDNIEVRAFFSVYQLLASVSTPTYTAFVICTLTTLADPARVVSKYFITLASTDGIEPTSSYFHKHLPSRAGSFNVYYSCLARPPLPQSSLAARMAT